MLDIAQSVLSWSLVRAAGIVLALGEINFLFTLLAVVLTIEFIGKNLDLRAAMIAFAYERFQVARCFKTGTMCRSSHFFSPFSLFMGFCHQF